MENGYGYGYGYGYGLYGQGSGVWRSLRDGDFEEEDVWAVLKERKDSNSQVIQSNNNFEPLNSVRRSLPSATRMIPTGSSSSGNTNLHKNESRGVKQQSAPVSIPDWSKIYGKKSKKSSKLHDYDGDDDHKHEHDVDDCRDSDDDDDVVVDDDDEDEDEDEDDEDGYNNKIPPHEFIARRLARSHISSFSVFEGVGRTLKGRDLSKVRNAILTKTGFLE